MNNKFTTCQEVFAWLESFTNLEGRGAKYTKRTYRTDRMVYLLGLFENPHESYETIHLAGSKGKGSTAAFLAYSLKAAGFITGLYTSPHVTSYLERITIIGQPSDREVITALGSQIKEVVDRINLKEVSDYTWPTTFELLTLLGFLYFREKKCRYVVVETGLGGRLDATNVVKPAASVITPIELEHQDILGNTLEEIAREKGGIIKPGVPSFSGFQKPPVKAVLKEIAPQTHFLAREITIEIKGHTLAHTEAVFSYEGDRHTFLLSMKGEVQAQNAALAFLVLRKCFTGVSIEAIREGFRGAFLPGRMEILEGLWVFDGAHTPESVGRCAALFNTLFPEPGILIFGAVEGKLTEEMARILAPAFKDVIISRPGTFRPSDLQGNYELFHSLNERTLLLEEPSEAYEKARQLSAGRRPVLVTGSFYMVPEIRRFLKHK